MNRKLEQVLEWLKKYKKETNCKGVVFGLSGGKDSTVVAMLVRKVWGSNALALIMPNGEQADIEEAKEIAETIGIPYSICNIEEAYDGILEAYPDNLFVEASDKALTNVAPRLRMIMNYLVAQSIGYRVIGTGNLSEKYIGWTTKYGDSGYDFNPIGSLCCTEVIEIGLELAEEFGLDKKYIVKTPADGLCGKSDEESFGFTYQQLDNYILNGDIGPYQITVDDYVMDRDGAIAIMQKIEEMHKYSEHKREMPPVPFISRG